MRAKSKLTAFNTKNVNVSALNPETYNSLIQSKIFSNEFLSKEQFLEFNHLKSIARGLGFKYIWHRDGRFLIKKRNGENTYEFSSSADLHALSALYTDNIGRKTIDAVAGHNLNVLANKSPVQGIPLPRMINEA